MHMYHICRHTAFTHQGVAARGLGHRGALVAFRGSGADRAARAARAQADGALGDARRRPDARSAPGAAGHDRGAA